MRASRERRKVQAPADYAARIKRLRAQLEMTPPRLADVLGVSTASIDRWERGEGRPSSSLWERISAGERFGVDGLLGKTSKTPAVRTQGKAPEGAAVAIDFAANPVRVAAFVEAHRLSNGYLYNPAFATETSLVVPLPHQRIAVYERMLRQSQLRFLLADDAGAGKTIMSGLYIREMLARHLLRRVLIVVPAGLVGNWECELRRFFRLEFSIVESADIRSGNPFVGSNSNLIIISLDTIRGSAAFTRLSNPAVEPYDLAIFDEAHKLSADRDASGIRKTARYRLAESLAGVPSDSPEWRLSWSVRHLILLTATPHMGKDHPYYFLWRLLEPDALATFEAFQRYPADLRARHFVRRTKEEMIDFEGVPIYPERLPTTLVYELASGQPSERELYEAVSKYIETHYNLARHLNRSAARLAMSVFQRRLASSPYALLRSMQRKLDFLNQEIDAIRSGRSSIEHFVAKQHEMDTRRTQDPLDITTADEEDVVDGEEQHDTLERELLAADTSQNIADLESERDEVDRLCRLAKAVDDLGHDSKFAKLSEWLDTLPGNEKLIIFTEHRDTLESLKRRLEGRGLTDKIAVIHGGMGYREREAEVERFRTSEEQGGARYLLATDAAGEGINLQFCWRMINYDIPWNPARLEQRMGRIHRYGQEHDPVYIANLVAGNTREGRVLLTLLEKLDRIRKELGSDKVFDIIGRLFEGRSLREFMEEAVTERGVVAAEAIGAPLTTENVRKIEAEENRIYGETGDVAAELPRLREDLRREVYRRLLPGYVRRFIESAAPKLGLVIKGDLDSIFSFATLPGETLEWLWPALERYPEVLRDRLSIERPPGSEQRIFLHPGEPVFDRFCLEVCERFLRDALRGAVFVDAATKEPYFFHLARIAIVRDSDASFPLLAREELLESRLLALKQTGAGDIEELPIEELLLTRPSSGLPPKYHPIAVTANSSVARAKDFLTHTFGQKITKERQLALQSMRDEHIRFAERGFDLELADLTERRNALITKANEGASDAQDQLTQVRQDIAFAKQRRLETIQSYRHEPELVRLEVGELLALALIIPSDSPEDAKRRDDEIEAIAVRYVTSFEEAVGAIVTDVSLPERAIAAGLTERPGFDLLSRRPDGSELCIEVKGRARVGDVDVSENEWAKACNLRDRYWLYVVFDCAAAEPRLERVCDPFAKLLTSHRGVVVSAESIIESAED